MIIANDATVKGGTYYPVQGPSSCPLGVTESRKSGLVRVVQPKECGYFLLHPEEAGDSLRVLYRGDFLLLLFILFILFTIYYFFLLLFYDFMNR